MNRISVNRISVNRISVTKDFTKLPGGRYVTDGPYSGERFREELLIPALKQGAVEVDLDGTLGYGSSFLEEAFGGLARAGFSAETIKSRLTLISTEHYVLAERIWAYIDAAERLSNAATGALKRHSATLRKLSG